MVIWLMGLSGSGKTTLAIALNKALHTKGIRSCLLDGDMLRQGINVDLSFSLPDRIENVRHIAHIANILSDNQMLPIVAVITPFEQQRTLIKKILGTKLRLIYLDCPLNICIQRDPKGLYKSAIENRVPDFTGITSQFELPSCSDLKIFSSELNVVESLKVLQNWLELPSLQKVKQD